MRGWPNLATNKAWKFLISPFFEVFWAAASAAANTCTPTTQPTPSNEWALSNNKHHHPINSSWKFPGLYHHHRPWYHHRHHTNKMAHLCRWYQRLVATFQRLYPTQSIAYTEFIHTPMVSTLGFVCCAHIVLPDHVLRCDIMLFLSRNNEG